MRPDPPRKWLPAALRELKLANTVNTTVEKTDEKAVETTAEKDVDKTTAKTAKAAEKVAKAVDITTAKTAKAAEKVVKTVEKTTAKTVKTVENKVVDADQAIQKTAKKRKRSDTSTDAQANVVDVTNVPAEMLEADKPEQNAPTSSFPGVVQQISRNMTLGILPPGMDSDSDMECAQVDRRVDDRDVSREYETAPKLISAPNGATKQAGADRRRIVDGKCSRRG